MTGANLLMVDTLHAYAATQWSPEDGPEVKGGKGKAAF